MPLPLAPHLDESKKLCEQARVLREAVRITVAISKEAVARSHRIVARIKERGKTNPPIAS
jgi:hypothetical protein